MTIGRQFKLLRRERGLTLKMAAHGILSVSSLSKFENGTSQLAADRFFLLLDQLNLDWDVFAKPRSRDKQPFLQRYLAAARHADVQELASILRQLPLANVNQRLLLHLTLHNDAPERFSILPHEQSQAQSLLMTTADWSLLLRLIAVQLAKIIGLDELSQLIAAFSNQIQRPNTPQDHFNLANRMFLAAVLRYVAAGKLTEARNALNLMGQATVGDLGIEFQIACVKRLLMIYSSDKVVALQGRQEFLQLKKMLAQLGAPAWTATWLPAIERLAAAKGCSQEA